mmetsp:Transcript_6823/g.20752  ORF Transcript_6823/g.20752 Transcript_6823/m.20752 type:complete len:197 (+) Transcript_6823:1004-1594(+)
MRRRAARDTCLEQLGRGRTVGHGDAYLKSATRTMASPEAIAAALRWVAALEMGAGLRLQTSVAEEEEEEEDVVVASKGARAVRRKRSAQPEDVTLWRAAHNHQVEASTPSAGECAGFFARPHLLLACGRQLASVAAVETSFDQLGSAALCWRAADTAVVINSLVGPWFLIITVILYLCTNKLTDRQPELRLCPCTT